MSEIRFSEEEIQLLNRRFTGTHPEEILSWAVSVFGDDAVLSTGFGPSGLVLMHKLSLIKPGVKVFCLDTDLLFNETYELMDRLTERLSIEIVHVRSHLSLEEQERQYGKELWKTDPDKCCYLRKVLPLKMFLDDKQAWISGIRRDQSKTRSQAPVVSREQLYDVIKINPLATWTEDEIWDYIRINEIPYNRLHDDGYPSLGCVPCTRPVNNGENPRAGRWAGMQKSECGIHR